MSGEANHRFVFDNRITTGNLLTIAGGVLLFLFMFFDLREANTSLAGRVALNEKDITHMASRLADQKVESERRWLAIEVSLNNINTKLDGLRGEMSKKQDRTNAQD